MANVMSRILVLLVSGVIVACSKPAMSQHSRESDKNFTHVQDTDPAMSAAITTAKKTSSAFMEALRHPKPSFHDFNVKKPYPAKPSANEHMWIADIQEVVD